MRRLVALRHVDPVTWRAELLAQLKHLGTVAELARVNGVSVRTAFRWLALAGDRESGVVVKGSERDDT